MTSTDSIKAVVFDLGNTLLEFDCKDEDVQKMFELGAHQSYEYFKEQGYPLGESKIRTIPPTDGEEMIEETTIKPGLCNVIQLRYELNASYYRELEKSIPEWPWPFQP